MSFVQSDIDAFTNGRTPNHRSVLTCPECGGVLWELQEGALTRYRCHVGHVYSIESMIEEQGQTLEAALWTAVRALEERAALLSRLATQAETRGHNHTSERFLRAAADAEQDADAVRKVLAKGTLKNDPEAPTGQPAERRPLGPPPS
jgi:two-component system chemotaxis response regulator CheB